jgi:hypothetical protein
MKKKYKKILKTNLALRTQLQEANEKIKVRDEYIKAIKEVVELNRLMLNILK